MNIFLITDSYPPEIRSASVLMQELAEDLIARGHAVTVFTTAPKYNLADSGPAPRLPRYAVENRVQVVRLWTPPIHKANFLVRGVSHLTLPMLFRVAIARHVAHMPASKPDAVFVYSPPLTLASVGTWAKRRFHAKMILNVQDIFPQNAIDLGVLSNPVLISMFEMIESRAYQSADAIVVHSDGNRRFLVEQKNRPEDQVHVLHNWIDASPYAKASRSCRFRHAWSLDDRFIMLFAGVVGPSQGLDLILDLAEAVKEVEDVCFLIVGDGTEKPRLVADAQTRGLDNIVFKPFVSTDDYPDLVKDADVGLVSLTSLNKTPVVPGKILGYMAAGLPVLAFLNEESDAHRIIADAACGLSARYDDREAALKATQRMCTERTALPAYGHRGYQYVTEHFSKQKCIDSLQELLPNRRDLKDSGSEGHLHRTCVEPDNAPART